MEVNNVKLATVAVKPDQYPTDNLPEIAFVGRSNVGKSSLINTMINRKAMARTSQNPGKTRTINFYLVEDSLYFVDLPGYGYAKISRQESAKWGEMIEKYLLNRNQLKAIVMLVDIRHEPTKNDKMLYEWLVHYNHRIVLVATKFDKIRKSQLTKYLKSIREGLQINSQTVVYTFSSLSKEGKDTLWQHLEEIIAD